MFSFENVSGRRSWLSIRRRRLLLAFALSGVLVVVVFHRQLFDGNFGVVDAERGVFRSAQPVEPQMSRLFASHHFASVLNLRGGSPDHDPWYADEVRATRRLGINFYDFPMSATRRPTRNELLTLLDLFDRCTYPLLIHCKSGSDRTGLASALFMMHRQGCDPERALAAFTLAHGHFGMLGTERLHEPFHEYRRWLDAQRLTHTPARFRTWIEHDYSSRGPERGFRPLQAGPRRLVATQTEANSPAASTKR